MSQIETMRQSAKRETSDKLKPQQLLKEVEALAAVVQTFRQSVSDMERQAKVTQSRLAEIEATSKRMSTERRKHVITAMIMVVLGSAALTMVLWIGWSILQPTKSSAIEDRVMELMTDPAVPQDVKNWLFSNVISPTP